MKNFARKSFTEKKTWGILGKIQEFYSPEQFQDESKTLPLNANPLDSWDSTRSRYRRRVQGPLPNDFQQGGVVPQVSPSPDVTPTPTPSSTPYILPETPALWYDSTNTGSIDYISSGGTNYVSNWRSIGTYQKTLSGDSTNTMPTLVASSKMPGTPLIVKFTKNATAGLRQYLSQRFDTTQIPQSGFTIFQVFANPDYNYSGTSTANGFGYQLFLSSGNTSGGFNIPAILNYNNGIGALTNSTTLVTAINGVQTTNTLNGLSALSLNEKYLYTQVARFSGNAPYWEINESGATMSNVITGVTSSPISSISLGMSFTSAGAMNTTINSGAEIGEIMIFNRELSAGEIDQVQNYLKNKWRYSEWPTPAPSATPTNTPTSTITNTPTNTPTATNTPTPSETPGPLTLYKLQGPYLYTLNNIDTISGCTGTTTANGIQADFVDVSSTVNFEIPSFSSYTTSSVIDIDATFQPIAGYEITVDPTIGDAYDRMVLSGYTYNPAGSSLPDYIEFTGTTYFYSGSTQISYNENGAIIYDNLTNTIQVAGDYANFLFNVDAQ